MPKFDINVAEDDLEKIERSKDFKRTKLRERKPKNKKNKRKKNKFKNI